MDEDPETEGDRKPKRWRRVLDKFSLTHKDASPIEWEILLLVFTAIFSSCYSICFVFPFLPDLILYYGHAEEDKGYYSGIIASGIFAGRIISSYFWGWLSDRKGRKPVLITCVVLTSVTNVLVGFCPGVWSATAMRFINGTVNGVVVISKAVLYEVSDNSNQAACMGIIGLAWGSGIILGPLISGYLAFPADRWPEVFSATGMFGVFPVLLPSIVASLVGIMWVPLLIWRLPETRNRRKHVKDIITVVEAEEEEAKDTTNLNKQTLEPTGISVNNKDNGVQGDRTLKDNLTVGNGQSTGKSKTTDTETSKNRVHDTTNAINDAPSPSPRLELRQPFMPCSTDIYSSMSDIALSLSRSDVRCIPYIDNDENDEGDAARNLRSRAVYRKQTSVEELQRKKSAVKSDDTCRSRISSRKHSSLEDVTKVNGGNEIDLNNDSVAKDDVTVEVKFAGCDKTPPSDNQTENNCLSPTASDEERKAFLIKTEKSIQNGGKTKTETEIDAKKTSCLQKFLTSGFVTMFKLPDVRNAVAIYCIISFAAIGFDECFTVWASTSTEFDGMGFRPDQIGAALGLSSTPLIFLQVFLFPAVEKRIGAKRTFEGFCLILILISSTIISLRVLRLYPAALWGLLLTLMGIMKVAQVTCFTACSLFINNSVTPDLSGSVNGMAMTATAMLRTLAPTVGGSLFSWSIKTGRHIGFPLDVNLVFLLFSAFYLLSNILCAVMSSRLNKQKKVEGKNEE